MNSGFLSEVLTSEGSHVPNISNKITELVSHTNNLKNEVKNIVESSSIRFTPLLKENEKLITKSNNLIKDMKQIQKLLDEDIQNELTVCSNELETWTSSLKEIKIFLQILDQLLEINSIIKKAKEKINKKEYYECSKLVTTLKALVKENSDKLKLVDVFKILSQEVVLTYELLLHQTSVIWSETVTVLITAKEPNLTNVEFIVNLELLNDLSQALKALQVLQINTVEKKFGQSLLNEILKKVVVNKSKISTIINNKKAMLNIEINNDNKKPNYSEIFDSTIKIIEFLKSNLNIEIFDGNFLHNVGKQISKDFAEFFIKECLSDTIPTTSEDLDKYKVVVEHTEDLEKKLLEIGFLPEGSSSLLDYARNVNVLFANKLCQSYLHKARIIMKKDLYNVTNCEEVVSDISLLPSQYKNELKVRLHIQDDVVKFSQCQISKQAEELMTLLNSIVREMTQSLEMCAVRLFYTVRNILEMYSAVVPLHHKKFLETLPHQAALFHNNCLYFTHNAIRIAVENYNKIPEVIEDHFSILLEEAIVLRSLAAETLQVTVNTQQNVLTSIIRDSGFAKLNENPDLDPHCEKVIRQCIRQLQILRTVWVEVLPLNVYNRAMGYLLDSIMECIIHLIISVEDISSDTSSELVSCFNIILDKGPSLLTDEREIFRHCRKWSKFKEFVGVLNGSLKDIEDRWTNGVGPLAVEFAPEQVKHMIRALFQNSKRRAEVLALIQ